MGLLIFYLLLAIGISFLCSVLEAVILSVTPSYIRINAEQGKKGSSLLRSLKEDIDRPLSAILTLNTIAHTVGAAGVGAQATAVFGEAYFGLISAVLTILILIFSEVIPKTIGARYWRQLAVPAARTIRVLVYILYPLVRISEVFTRIIIRKKRSQTITREEIAVLANLGAKEGVVREDEGRLIGNILRMKTLRVRDIMTPRPVVKAVNELITLKEFMKDKDIAQFSRIPVYTETIEDSTNYVLKTDVLQKLVDVKGSLRVQAIKRPAIIVPENLLIHKLFEQLLVKKEHIALVVDEYGGFEGIVTMEDIIETILGLEIQDETDAHTDMQKLAREKWKIRARHMRLDVEEDEDEEDEEDRESD